MRPSDKKVHNVIKKMFFKASPELDKDIWVETLRTHDEFNTKIFNTEKYKIGRIIMNNKITKLAAVSVIIIVILIGIQYSGNSFDGSSVAWGQVLSDMEKVPTVIYRTIIQVNL